MLPSPTPRVILQKRPEVTDLPRPRDSGPLFAFRECMRQRVDRREARLPVRILKAMKNSTENAPVKAEEFRKKHFPHLDRHVFYGAWLKLCNGRYIDAVYGHTKRIPISETETRKTYDIDQGIRYYIAENGNDLLKAHARTLPTQ